MDLIDPPPNHPPPKIIGNWNSQLIKLVGSKEEFVKIKNFLIKENWSRSSCINVLNQIEKIEINDDNYDIISFLVKNCDFHLL
jgi:hypothetical protein